MVGILVTARREDVQPKRALLLRTETAGTDWEVWDLTPVDVVCRLFGI